MAITELELEWNETFIRNLQELKTKGTEYSADSLVDKISDLHVITAFNPIDFGYQKLTEMQNTNNLPDSLRQNLAIYYNMFSDGFSNIDYEEHFPFFKEDYDRAEWQLSAELRLPLTKKYLRYNDNEPVTISNYNQMIEDEEFHNSVTFMISIRRWELNTSYSAIEHIDNLQAMISEELKARS